MSSGGRSRIVVMLKLYRRSDKSVTVLLESSRHLTVSLLWTMLSAGEKKCGSIVRGDATESMASASPLLMYADRGTSRNVSSYVG